ncbi:hypothetical protein RRG08_057284 [Elysia crispata]|uniref:Uncharacterized protein n=1 Tax=Elysia crispata TaxID=231223 RepID=A0AAE0ZTA1_9GAST|nr:hypothetical protein RRG08_057284 [Elysia crispata]
MVLYQSRAHIKLSKSNWFFINLERTSNWFSNNLERTSNWFYINLERTSNWFSINLECTSQVPQTGSPSIWSAHHS